ncbi:hypothetical protein CT0861_00681 [Colletotrichum tofieldiae]|uniref:Uncharacterized protein n=1 Tax=Colletotrichum tofieldiae TaxID=708197 RepID=A0A161Y834_9PEZI|nr:hypothetical protein CT0861_00681 [Colletotrichum tofieldiae]
MPPNIRKLMLLGVDGISGDTARTRTLPFYRFVVESGRRWDDVEEIVCCDAPDSLPVRNFTRELRWSRGVTETNRASADSQHNSHSVINQPMPRSKRVQLRGVARSCRSSQMSREQAGNAWVFSSLKE